ncbi:MAG: hypothetical protein ACRDJN_31345 [Chloroflexota bacterium]
MATDGVGCYPADTGCASAAWEAHWRATYGATVLATPTRRLRRAWLDAVATWAAGKRQVVEQVIEQLTDCFAWERHPAKTRPGLLARLAAKVAAFICGQWRNGRHGRPLRHFADLLIERIGHQSSKVPRHLCRTQSGVGTLRWPQQTASRLWHQMGVEE